MVPDIAPPFLPAILSSPAIATTAIHRTATKERANTFFMDPPLPSARICAADIKTIFEPRGSAEMELPKPRPRPGAGLPRALWPRGPERLHEEDFESQSPLRFVLPVTIEPHHPPLDEKVERSGPPAGRLSIKPSRFFGRENPVEHQSASDPLVAQPSRL